MNVKRFSVLLMAIMISLSAMSLPLKKPCGDGTPECPYQIGEISELMYFVAVVNLSEEIVDGEPTPKNTGACAVLTSDIDLSPVCGEGIGSWYPMGRSGNAYNGHFDGRNHKIHNLYMKGETFEGQGFFGVCSGTVENLILASGYINTAGVSVGGIVGVGAATIINCHNYADITAFSFNPKIKRAVPLPPK